MPRPWVLGLCVLLAACGRSGPEPSPGPSPVLLERLERGVNASNWFEFRGGWDVRPQRYHLAESDWRWIASRGLGHVRIPFDPALMVTAEGTLHGERIAELQAALDSARTHGLAVVLAMQPSDQAKERIAGQPAAVRASQAFWRRLAGALNTTDPNLLVFEPLNEPQIEDAQASRAVVGALADAIRQAAPRHTLLVSGHRWSAVEELVQLRPFEDRNRIYGFHFYEPHNFTHQGADWGWPMWSRLAGLPYPSSPGAVEGLFRILPPETHEHVRHYGEQGWDRARLAMLLDRAAGWARRHDLPVLCSEFGVYRYSVRAEHRANWLRDMRGLLAERGIGWTHWDFAGGFGLVQGDSGQRQVDREAVQALGLTPG